MSIPSVGQSVVAPTELAAAAATAASLNPLSTLPNDRYIDWSNPEDRVLANDVIRRTNTFYKSFFACPENTSNVPKITESFRGVSNIQLANANQLSRTGTGTFLSYDATIALLRVCVERKIALMDERSLKAKESGATLKASNDEYQKTARDLTKLQEHAAANTSEAKKTEQKALSLQGDVKHRAAEDENRGARVAALKKRVHALPRLTPCDACTNILPTTSQGHRAPIIVSVLGFGAGIVFGSAVLIIGGAIGTVGLGYRAVDFFKSEKKRAKII